MAAASDDPNGAALSHLVSRGDIAVQQVIPTPGVLQYEQYGFTNCVRFEGVL
ncbi:MAG: hypothetical protein WBW74_15955 [Xanthobacteraceae bacterium]